MIGPDVRIGSGAVIGMGTMIRKDVAQFQVVVDDGSRKLYMRSEYDKKREQYESDNIT